MPQLEPNQICFALSQTQWQQCRAWQHRIDEQMVRQQIAKELCDSIRLSLQDSLKRGQPTPNYDAIGSAYSYTFFPTLSGFALKLTHAFSQEALQIFAEDNLETAIVMSRISDSAYERLVGWHAHTTDDLLEARLRSHYSYGCCNTTLGQIVIVRHLATQEEWDLSDYGTW